MKRRFVGYVRVSTAKQGASGLGLEAQRCAVRDFVRDCSGELLSEFEEIESGKNADRPSLREAMNLCELTGAKLVIAKLDRLSRSVHFLSGLMEQGVDFVALDMPQANKLTIHIMAAVAQQEREAISSRTKAALATINERLARGEAYVSRRSGRSVTRLGNPNGLVARRPDLGVIAIKAQADEFARRVGSRVIALRGEGLSFAAIAAELNDKGIRSPRGAKWTATSARRVLLRTGAQRT